MENLTTKYKIDLLNFLQNCPYQYEEGTHNKEYVHIKFKIIEEKHDQELEDNLKEIKEIQKIIEKNI